MPEKNHCKISCREMPLVGEADHGLAIRPMIHCDRRADFHVLIYLLKGGMEIIEDGISYTLTPGTLFFLKAGAHHWGEKPFLAGTAWYYVHFYAEEPPKEEPPFRKKTALKEKLCLTGEENRVYLTLPKRLELTAQNPIKKKIEELIRRHNTGDMPGSGIMLWEIFTLCVQAQDQSAGREWDDRTEKVLCFLEENYRRGFTAKELSLAAGISAKYAGTLFKERTGLTVGEYQLTLKLKEAETLLVTTEMTLAEIAAQTGFYDAFYFSKIFKREKGMSPMQFRKAYIPRI